MAKVEESYIKQFITITKFNIKLAIHLDVMSGILSKIINQNFNQKFSFKKGKLSKDVHMFLQNIINPSILFLPSLLLI